MKKVLLVLAIMVVGILVIDNPIKADNQKKICEPIMIIEDKNGNGLYDPGEWFLDENNNMFHDNWEICGNPVVEEQQDLIIVNTTSEALQELLNKGFISIKANKPFLVMDSTQKLKEKLIDIHKINDILKEGDKVIIPENTIITLETIHNKKVYIKTQRDIDETASFAPTYRVSYIDVSSENSDTPYSHSVTCNADTYWSSSQSIFVAIGGLHFSTVINVYIESPHGQLGHRWRHKGSWTAVMGYSGSGYGGQQETAGFPDSQNFDLYDYDPAVHMTGEYQTCTLYASSFGWLYSECSIQVDIGQWDDHLNKWRWDILPQPCQDEDSVGKWILII